LRYRVYAAGEKSVLSAPGCMQVLGDIERLELRNEGWRCEEKRANQHCQVNCRRSHVPRRIAHGSFQILAYNLTANHVIPSDFQDPAHDS
jgi:hypothetical protein